MVGLHEVTICRNCHWIIFGFNPDMDEKPYSCPCCLSENVLEALITQSVISDIIKNTMDLNKYDIHCLANLPVFDLMEDSE